MTNLTGAPFLANQFRTMIADAKAKLAKAGEEMSEAVSDLHDTADHAVEQVKIVKAETADLKAALGLSSNGSPEPLDDVVPMHATMPPKVEYEPPPPFYGPAQPPPLPRNDVGDVKQIKLATSDPKIGLM